MAIYWPHYYELLYDFHAEYQEISLLPSAYDKVRYALNILKSWDKGDIYLSTFHLPLRCFNICSIFPC